MKPTLHSALSVSPAPSAPACRATVMAQGLHLLWSLLATAAHVAGVATLQPGSGLILLTGVAVTAALFLGLARLPRTEQPPLSTLVTAQAAMGILWTALYGRFAAGSGELLLAGGMYVSAVLYALPVLGGRRLGFLALGALGTAAVGLLLDLVWSTGNAPATMAVDLLALGGLALILGLVVATGWRMSRDRARLEDRYDELRQNMDRITRRADRDQLTNSYTRRFIVEMLGREKARSDRNGEAFCVLLLDIDHFKSMNDRYGHLAGDRILASFARRVRTELRDMDSVNAQLPSPGQPALGRYGGEEFLVVLPHTTMRGALRAAERIRRSVVRHRFEGEAPVTVSIGIAEYRAAETVSDLLARADAALYAAKNAGRNRVHCAGREGDGSAVVMPEIPRAS
jgi:diguanylate cyclase (GGDEF)-like protein